MTRHTFENYRDDYADLWAHLTIRPAYAATVEVTAEKILANKERYAAVARETGVPWFVVAIIHKMEGDMNFNTHLHNGDPLTRRTWQVPRGRPTTGTPPFTWHESAVDAIRYDGLDKVRRWSIERIAFAFEKFNGFGSRARGVPSAYLWSFSTAYTRGKFVRDGVWNARAVSEQSGAMVILKALAARDPSIVLVSEGALPAPAVDEGERPVYAPDRGLAGSRTLWGTCVAAVGWAVGKVAGYIGLTDGFALSLVSDVAAAGETVAAPFLRLAALIGANIETIGAYAVLAGLVIVIAARVDAARNGKIG